MSDELTNQLTSIVTPSFPQCDEFVLAELADEEQEEFHLAAPEGRSREEMERFLGATPSLPTQRFEQDERFCFRFSLLELMAVMTFAALALSAATWLPTDLFAGAMGFVAVFGMVVYLCRPPQTRMAHIAWGTVLTIYVASSAVAFVKSFL